MASDLNIPQFGTGATPGLNAPRMQAIWTFLKSIALGGSGSVINSDKVAATTPSAVGLSMLSAADKAAQQALVSLPEVSDSGLVARWSMDSVPEIPDDPAGVTYLWDKLTTTGFSTDGGVAVSASSGLLTFTFDLIKAGTSPAPAGATFRARIKFNMSGTVQLISGNPDGSSQTVIATIAVVANEWNTLNATLNTGATFSAIIHSIGTAIGTVSDYYVGTGAYLPNSLLDNSGNGNHGTIYGATPVEGISGKALAFIGSGISGAEMLSPLLGTIGSMSIWFKRGVINVDHILFSNAISNTGCSGWTLIATSANSLRLLNGGASAFQTIIIASITNTDWHHFVFSVDATNIYYTYDGGAFTTVPLTVTPVQSTLAMNLGRNVNSSGRLTGTIDEPRIYNRALSAEEFYSLYMSKGRGPDAQVKSVRGVANSLVVRNASGQLQDMADYGVGAYSKDIGTNYDLDTLKTNGFYHGHDPRGTNYATVGDVDYLISVEAQSVTTGRQIVSRLSDAVMLVRHWYAVSSWTAWSIMWTSASDDNGGQPPAPKPRAATDSDIGQWAKKFAGVGGALVAPASGSWAYFALQMDATAHTVYNDNSGVVAGGTTVLPAIAGHVSFGFFWRIA